MIKGLTAGIGLSVSSNNVMPYVSPNTTNPITGMIRVWGNDIQVFDGSCWLQCNTSNAVVQLDDDTQSILNWGRRKMAEERDVELLIQKHPGLKDAKDRYEVMLALVKDHANG